MRGGTDVRFAFTSYGERANVIIMENSRHRRVDKPVNDGYLYLDGTGVMDFALNDTVDVVRNFLTGVGLQKDDIDLFACHQANKLIINSLADSLQVPKERVPFTAGEIGNESSASIPLVLTEKANEMKLNRTLCVGFGVGLSIGIALADFSQTVFYGVSEL